MPRKVNGMPFELHPSPKKDAKGRNLLYVIPMQGLSSTLDDIDIYCSENGGLARNELVSVFNYFVNAAAQFLADGSRIVTPMGTFAPRLSLRRPVTDPRQVSADDVEWRGIDFQPSKAFMANVKKWSRGFHTAPTCRRTAAGPTEGQLKRALQDTLDEDNNQTTVSRFMVVSGLTRHLAQRYLDSCCEGERPFLSRILMGRTFVYSRLEKE